MQTRRQDDGETITVARRHGEGNDPLRSHLLPTRELFDAATSPCSITTCTRFWRLIINEQAPCIYGVPVLPETERKSITTLPNPTLLLIEIFFFLKIDFSLILFIVRFSSTSAKMRHHPHRPAWVVFQFVVMLLEEIVVWLWRRRRFQSCCFTDPIPQSNGLHIRRLCTSVLDQVQQIILRSTAIHHSFSMALLHVWQMAHIPHPLPLVAGTWRLRYLSMSVTSSRSSSSIGARKPWLYSSGRGMMSAKPRSADGVRRVFDMKSRELK